MRRSVAVTALPADARWSVRRRVTHGAVGAVAYGSGGAWFLDPPEWLIDGCSTLVQPRALKAQPNSRADPTTPQRSRKDSSDESQPAQEKYRPIRWWAEALSGLSLLRIDLSEACFRRG